MSATRFYSSPLWQKLRGGAIKRDGGACTFCGWISPDGRGLSVDHIIRRTAGGPDHLDNLRTLCIPCHRQHTGREQTKLFRSADRRTTTQLEEMPRLRTSQAW